jgi:hypothetical protein
VAVTVTDVTAETPEEVIPNTPDVAPAGIASVAGTFSAVLLDAKLMTTPPVGAGSLRVTVPVAVAPPGIDVGFTVRLCTT